MIRLVRYLTGAVADSLGTARSGASRPRGPRRPVAQGVQRAAELHFVVVTNSAFLVYIYTAQAHCRATFDQLNILCQIATIFKFDFAQAESALIYVITIFNVTRSNNADFR